MLFPAAPPLPTEELLLVPPVAVLAEPPTDFPPLADAPPTAVDPPLLGDVLAELPTVPPTLLEPPRAAVADVPPTAVAVEPPLACMLPEVVVPLCWPPLLPVTLLLELLPPRWDELLLAVEPPTLELAPPAAVMGDCAASFVQPGNKINAEKHAKVVSVLMCAMHDMYQLLADRAGSKALGGRGNAFAVIASP